MKPIHSIRIALGLSLAWGAFAFQAAAEAVPEQLDIASFPASVVDDVFVPVPSEIFAVLDKLGDPDWRGELRKDGYGSHADRTRLSLIFGVAVADGFLAVEAEDKDAIESTGREILRLANAIGIQGSVTPHVQSIIEAANESNWGAVRNELDRTQVTVRSTMEKMRDDDLARCVSIGGWLRGTEVVCSVVTGSYSADKAELLSQPDVVAHFSDNISNMDASVKQNEKLVEVAGGLKSIQGLMQGTGGSIGADAVVEIHKECAKMVQSIVVGK